jgi:hypothetical protein
MSYSERYTRLSAREKVGDPFNPKRNETSLSIRATFIHFWEARRRLFLIIVSCLRHSRGSASSVLWKLRSQKIRRREVRPYLLKTPVTNECLPSFTTLSAKHYLLICILLCLQFTVSKIIDLCCLLSHILSASLQSF